MADMDGVFQIEMRGKSGEVVGVMVHIVAVGRLRGAAMATAVMSDDAIALLQEEQHLASQSSADSGQPWLNTIG